jgi:hypothetical protein
MGDFDRCFLQAFSYLGNAEKSKPGGFLYNSLSLFTQVLHTVKYETD